MSDFLPSCPSLLPVPHCNNHMAFKRDFIHNMVGRKAKMYLITIRARRYLKGKVDIFDDEKSWDLKENRKLFEAYVMLNLILHFSGVTKP